RYAFTLRCRSSRPSSTSLSAAVAVIALETDARRNRVRSGSTGRLDSNSAAPYPRARVMRPPETNTKTRPGMRRRGISLGKNSFANFATAAESIGLAGSCASTGAAQAQTAVRIANARIPQWTKTRRRWFGNAHQAAFRRKASTCLSQKSIRFQLVKFWLNSLYSARRSPLDSRLASRFAATIGELHVAAGSLRSPHGAAVRPTRAVWPTARLRPRSDRPRAPAAV